MLYQQKMDLMEKTVLNEEELKKLKKLQALIDEEEKNKKTLTEDEKHEAMQNHLYN